MISAQSRTPEWIMRIREDSRGGDPILIEKIIMALTLVEELQLSGLDFIFKGGTSLLLLLGRPRRFSIDIDILVPKKNSLDDYFQAMMSKGAFHRYEENRRAGELPNTITSFSSTRWSRLKRAISCWKRILTRKLYMAATRAGQRLVITYVGGIAGSAQRGMPNTTGQLKVDLSKMFGLQLHKF